MAYVEHNVQDTPSHHGFSLLISVECACVEHYPWVYCTWSDVWRALPSNRVNAYVPVAEISASVQNSRFLRGQVI